MSRSFKNAEPAIKRWLIMGTQATLFCKNGFRKPTNFWRYNEYFKQNIDQNTQRCQYRDNGYSYVSSRPVEHVCSHADGKTEIYECVNDYQSYLNFVIRRQIKIISNLCVFRFSVWENIYSNYDQPNRIYGYYGYKKFDIFATSKKVKNPFQIGQPKKDRYGQPDQHGCDNSKTAEHSVFASLVTKYIWVDIGSFLDSLQVWWMAI